MRHEATRQPVYDVHPGWIWHSMLSTLLDSIIENIARSRAGGNKGNLELKPSICCLLLIHGSTMADLLLSQRTCLFLVRHFFVPTISFQVRRTKTIHI